MLCKSGEDNAECPLNNFDKLRTWQLYPNATQIWKYIYIYILYCTICHEWMQPTIFESSPDHRRWWGIRSPFIGASPISDKVGHGRHGPGYDTPTGSVVSGWENTTETDDDDHDDGDDLQFPLCETERTAGTPVSSCERARRLSSAAGYAFSMTNRAGAGDETVPLDSTREHRAYHEQRLSLHAP